MNDELLDVIDEDNRVIGQADKSTVHRQGLRHRVGAVLLRREDGKYLIPTASEIKAEAGRLYHSAAGHVLSGESYADCAKRELLEETGVEATDLEPLGTFWFESDYASRREKERFEVYEAKYRDGSGPVKLNEEQVDEKWMSVEELLVLREAGKEAISAPLDMTCKVILRMNEVNMSESLKVYFGCSMRGGYAYVQREVLAEFPKMIVELGHRLATDHQTRPGILEKEARYEHVYIHDRDYRWMIESDLGVFEISNPSLGVGGEISDMIHMGKPVLLLFNKSSEEKVSAYIRGKCGSSFVDSPLQCVAYQDLEGARESIRRFIDLCRGTS
jgi:8-oxo-dGTP pyrophosphatase MutT (NUDIX family)